MNKQQGQKILMQPTRKTLLITINKQQATRGGARPHAHIRTGVNVTYCRMPLGQNCRRHMFHVARTRELGYCGSMNKGENMETIKKELKNINDELLKLYNTPGMALQFQPSNLKILKKQIEKLITLEETLEYETNRRS